MTIDNLHALLPEKISDESAYDLVNFFMNITTELETYYFAQMRRHINDSKPIKPIKSQKRYQNKIL